MDLNKAYTLLEEFPFLQNAHLYKVLRSSQGQLTDHDKLELYLYRGNPFLLSYQIQSKAYLQQDESIFAPKADNAILDSEEVTTNKEINAEENLPELIITNEQSSQESPADEHDAEAFEENELSTADDENTVAIEPSDAAPEAQITNETQTEEAVQEPEAESPALEDHADEALLEPLYVSDVFLHDGIKVDNEIDSEFVEQERHKKEGANDETSLMVQRTFMEWLHYYKEKKMKDEKETREKESLRAMWQKEKLAAAIEEENEVVPEQVFKMAINSINDDDIVPSESLAEIYIKQDKIDKALDMYRKLSLQNPEKSAYFASKIKNLKQ